MVEFRLVLVLDNNTDKLLRIGSAAQAAGISRQSLQYYLMLGLLEATELTPSGHHLFDAKAVERIRLIKHLNDNGYPLREIRDIFLRDKL